MPDQTAPCPECETEASQIATETVQNMVEPFDNQEIVDEVQYRICETTDCPVVYFTDELDQQFEVDVIRETPSFKLENMRDHTRCVTVLAMGRKKSTKTSPKMERRISPTGLPNGCSPRSALADGNARSGAAVSEMSGQLSPKQKTPMGSNNKQIL